MALNKLEQINKQFHEIKKTGSAGEETAKNVLEVYGKSKALVQYFEENLSQPDSLFLQNFITFSGEDSVLYAQNVYMILKEMVEKLEGLE